MEPSKNIETLKNSIRFDTTSSTLNRRTSNADFSSKLRQAASHGTAFAARTLDNIAPVVPGGAVLSSVLADAAGALNTGALEPNIGVGPSVAPFASGVEGPFASGPQNIATSMASLQQNMMSSNLYMIALQQDIQQKTAKYMAISNLLKTKFDAEKTSISNMRA